MDNKIIISDSGRCASGYSDERNDCSVRALKEALGITYKEAYDILAEAGRKPKECFYFHKLAEYPFFVGNKTIKMVKVRLDERIRTVNQFVKDPRFKTGRYAIQVKKHVFAYINGQIIDTFEEEKKCKRIERVWEFIEPKDFSFKKHYF